MFSRRADDDDNMYDFNAAPSNIAAPGTSMGGAVGRAPMTAAYRSAGAPLQSSMGRNNNAVPGSRMGLTTGMSGGGGGEARPMTSVSGAGYKGSSTSKLPGGFDPLNIGKGPAPPLADKADNSPGKLLLIYI